MTSPVIHTTQPHERFVFGTVFEATGEVVAAAPRPKRSYSAEEVEAIRKASEAAGETRALAGVANRQADRCDDVSARTVDVLNQCDTSRAVWIILNRCNLRLDIKFLTLEIDDAVTTLVTATLVTNCNLAGVVTGRFTTKRFC